MDDERRQALLNELVHYKDQLLSLARHNLNPVLYTRLSPEDLVQEVFARACARESFFTHEGDVPIYFRLRTLFFQTLTDLQRYHLRSQSRDAYKEAHFSEETKGESSPSVSLEMLEGECTGPHTLVAREDKYSLLRHALTMVAENDRQILEMRHFDDLTNEECARLLHLSPKAASTRYVRALERLQKALLQFTEFKQ